MCERAVGWVPLISQYLPVAYVPNGLYPLALRRTKSSLASTLTTGNHQKR
ncbi:hypothetical protein [Lactiplantibacillus pentosus]|nr:hypothetical protein [Lactiplantibacillus pentosus]MBU7465163.1 hypothetical protein [Lactiplantibacillus pentosus]MBU7491174.1 hypothetical protein [Lactiplantibacillus pentosus]MBU7526790.1 hypothetical protein [Lactiplantibacillus pentosus]MDT6966808.1 hypothetical protein [Lactiplantibacillus pentosus]MDT6999678.1 hypothetical protein [Lactiplantibacillus pentosus]